MSFRGDVARCRCTSGAAQLAVFIAFHNFGATMPQRAAIEAESAQCRAAMVATCVDWFTPKQNPTEPTP